MKQKKKFILLTLIFMLIAVVFIVQRNMSNPIHFNTEEIEKIEIIKEGGNNKKLIENIEEINKVKELLNNIKYKRSKQEDINGWIYNIKIHYKNKTKVTSILFLQHRIKYNNIWYIGKKQYIDELNILFMG